MSFQPTQISGLLIWTDASTLGLANNATLSTWTNGGSGGTVNCTGTFLTNQLNGLPIVRFATTQTWTIASQPTLSVYSMFFVTRQRGGQNRRVLQGTANNQLYGYWGGRKRVIYIDGAPDQLVNATSDSAWDLFSHTRTAGSAYTFNWFGTSQFSAASSTATSLTGLAINTGAWPTEQSDCDVAEIILYNVLLPSIQVQQVEGYLAWKWGLQTSLPTTHPYYNFPPTSLLIQSYTELNLVNTSVRSGTITLPLANIPGRILTFKDIYGTFSNSTLTISTSGTDRFEDNTSSITLNNSFGSYTFAEGADNKWYTVGGSHMDTAAVSSITSISLFGNFVSSGSVITSTLQIKDTLTQSTNTVFYNSTLLFYSSPTNYFVVGPTKAPKWTFLPTRVPWLPTQLSGLILWLDGADPSTVSITNGVVLWQDKSTSFNNFRLTGSPIGTYNSQTSAISIPNGSIYSSRTTISLSTNTYLFIVSKLGATDATLRMLLGFTNISGSDYSIRFENGLLNGTPNKTGNANDFANTQYYVNGSFNPSFGSAVYTNINIISGKSTQTGSTGLTISSAFLSRFYIGDVFELLIYSSPPSAAQREQVEGYLAWKWGIVGSLPSTHPYKLAPP